MAARAIQWMKKFAINATVMFVALVVALLLAEGLVRLVAPQQLNSVRPDIWAPDDSLGWRVRENVHASINTGERPVTFVSDARGFRSADTGARARGDVNVLLLGDSFMQALQVDYPATLGARLEQKLSAALGRTVVVWNAGVNGWDPNQYYIREQQALARDAYDAVVTMIYVDNDIVPYRQAVYPAREPAEIHSFRMPRNFSRREWIDGFFYPFNDFFERRSHLFQLLKNGFDTVLLRLGLSEANFPIAIQRRYAADSGWRVTANIMADIAAEARRHAAAPIFGIIPAPYQTDSAAFEYYRRGFKLEANAIDVDQPQRILDSASAERGLTAIDALPAFREAGKGKEALFGHVDRHFTPRGHELMADLLMPALLDVLRRPAPKK